MPITIQCPNPKCQQTVSVSDTLSGRNVKCRKCGTSFVATPTLDSKREETRPTSTSSDAGVFPSLPTDFGRYRILQLLGKGGMGAVYLATDSQLNRKVALKVPFFNAREEPKRAERFVREARSAASLHHPNICTVFDAGEIDERPFITMAFIEGKPLEDIFSESQLLPVPRVLEIVRKVAVALQKAHDLSIVHRDLKPANIMISPDGEPVIMDFGLAVVVGDSESAEARLTQEGSLLGTPRYMSPEQVNADQKLIGPPTDIYALGVILFELLSGKPPYTGPLMTMLAQIATAPVPAVSDIRPEVGGRLSALCRKAMAKLPQDRFASMKELADAIVVCQTIPEPVPAFGDLVIGSPILEPELPDILLEPIPLAEIPPAVVPEITIPQPLVGVSKTSSPSGAPVTVPRPGQTPAGNSLSTSGKARRSGTSVAKAPATPATPAEPPGPAPPRRTPAELLSGVPRRISATTHYLVSDSTRMALTISAGGILVFLLLIGLISLSRGKNGVTQTPNSQGSANPPTAAASLTGTSVSPEVPGTSGTSP